MDIFLEPLAHDARCTEVPVHGSPFVLGRAADCDLPLASPLVSRHHCALSFDGEALRVEDLQSRNGTYVNRVPVTTELRLSDGDTLIVACVPFRVHIEAGKAPHFRRVCLHRARTAVSSLSAAW